MPTEVRGQVGAISLSFIIIICARCWHTPRSITNGQRFFLFLINSLIHCRTPRVDLAMNVTPSILGDLLCKYMHDEDNKHGLHVTNVRGDKWTSYGDGMLMEKCSKVIIL